MRKLMVLLAAVLFACGQTAVAESGDITVGKVELPDMNWGTRTISVELTNNTDWIKFIEADVQVDFQGTYLNPSRNKRSTTILEPKATITFGAAVLIPGNYGVADVRLRLYDAVDTLDQLLESQKFYDQPFTVRFHVPEAVKSYLQVPITVPPRLESHPYFDNEFGRLFLLLLFEGKTLDQIVEMVETDYAYVSSTAEFFEDIGLLSRVDGNYQTALRVIPAAEAEATRYLAEQTADELAGLLGKSMTNYQPILHALIDSGMVSKDSNNFLGGGSFLYKPYPTLSAIVLWYDLGSRFITPGRALSPFEGTDLCRANNPEYMYIVHGGEFVNGTHMYAVTSSTRSQSRLFATYPVKLACDEELLIKQRQNRMVRFSYDPENLPDMFVADTAIALEMSHRLTGGVDPILEHATTELEKLAGAYGHNGVSTAHRYWFWNLVATLTLTKMEAAGAVEPFGKRYYRFDSIANIGG